MKNSINKIKSALGEVQNTLNWHLVFKKGPKLAPVPANMEMLVQSSGMPTPQVQNLSIQLGGHEIGARGKVTKKGSIDLSLVENTKAPVLRWMLKYLDGYWSANGVDTKGDMKGSSEDLKCDVEMFLTDGTGATTISCVMVACLIVPDLSSSHGQDASELIRNFTLEYDDFHYKTQDISW